ncbi:hypothetical protein CR155_20365 [Pollutimonas nitritireducens]|uniref:Uncharacterized protein n=1 Tax=Pollutimonas nitritireducens TaxID=2045209 RepID=A0A2N4UAF5_9BURK|nr:hypothetical protein [Pollutimonas nitritireducens]PLC52004.1 hypothetical protein CR155_20365 [Pollutimonas nitritireducens]
MKLHSSMLTDRKTYLMQRLQHAAARGAATRYAVIETDTREHAERLLKKFAAAYDTALPAATKTRRRKAGEATTSAWCYERPERPEQPRYWIVLMVSDGIGRVTEREKLTSITDPRHRLALDGYELVHDGLRWSWRMVKPTYQYWEKRIRTVCALPPERRDPKMVEKLIADLSRVPGFRLARRQVGNLYGLLRREWVRLRPANDPLPPLPTFLPYVRALAKDKPGG